MNEQLDNVRLDAAINLKMAAASLKTVGMLMSESVQKLAHTADDVDDIMEQMIEAMGRSLEKMRYVQSRLSKDSNGDDSE